MEQKQASSSKDLYSVVGKATDSHFINLAEFLRRMPFLSDSVKAKKEAKKLWDSTRDEVTKERFKRARKEVKREVVKAKNDTYEELY